MKGVLSTNGVRAAMVGAALSMVLAGACAAAATATTTSHAVPIGSVPARPPSARVTGALPGASELRLTIALEPQDPRELASLAGEVATPGSPQFRHYLTVSQFAQRFGASAAQIAAVRSALSSQGLHVGLPAANALTLPVSGRAAQVEKTFSTSLSQVVLANGRSAYANTRPPSVTSSVAGLIEGVVGLDDVSHARALGVGPASSPPGIAAVSTPLVDTGGPQPCDAASTEATNTHSFTADEIASAYQFSGLYQAGDLGGGQTIALVEFEPYLPEDIEEYQTCYGTSASVTSVEVEGGPGKFEPKVKEKDGREPELDIDELIGLAPRASILVYQAPNSGAAELKVLSQIVSQDAAKVISDSWGECESESEARLAAQNTLLQEAAVQGQSFFAPSGDNGSTDCEEVSGLKDELAVDDPASQPFATGVGGTNLNLGSPRKESLWSAAKNASGGGISNHWTMPAYQSQASPSLGVINADSSGLPCAGGTTDCREVPDVSADADPASGYVVRREGKWEGSRGGTSASVPLWAAFSALVDASTGCSGVSIGFANPALYEVASTAYAANFNDITEPDPVTQQSTNDIISAEPLKALELFPVGPGYDMATGLGSPIGERLAVSLCALTPKPQAIEFTSTPPTPASVGGGAYVVAATASSGLAVSFSSGTPSVCSLAGATVNFVGAGTCTIDANQPGDAQYSAAPEVQQSFTVLATRAGSPMLAPTFTAVPSSNFSSLGASFNQRSGAITFTEALSGPGRFSWLLTFRNGRFGVFSARVEKCKQGQVRLTGRCRPSFIVFAEGSRAVAGAGSVSVTVKPTASGLSALENALRHKQSLPLTVTLSFRSSLGGGSVSRTQSLTVRLKKATPKKR